MKIAELIDWDDLYCDACPEPATHVGIDGDTYRYDGQILEYLAYCGACFSTLVTGIRWVHKPEGPYSEGTGPDESAEEASQAEATDVSNEGSRVPEPVEVMFDREMNEGTALKSAAVDTSESSLSFARFGFGDTQSARSPRQTMVSRSTLSPACPPLKCTI